MTAALRAAVAATESPCVNGEDCHCPVSHSPSFLKDSATTPNTTRHGKYMYRSFINVVIGKKFITGNNSHNHVAIANANCG